MFFFVSMGIPHLFRKSLLPPLLTESNEIMPHKVNTMMLKRGIFCWFCTSSFSNLLAIANIVKISRASLLSYITFLTTFFNTAKQKISSDPK